MSGTHTNRQCSENPQENLRRGLECDQGRLCKMNKVKKEKESKKQSVDGGKSVH